ncbi:hypothetical protein FJY68_12925 [candidate division WOR-3 bacterium]|uniref:Exo-alpha-sialidase n=1 Tax=candidate division WOR-3 bacterium TaxID=2052148 RepID=A0A938BUJ4_UNCW3|nr:hypothetical protein [candidate division WOR-3 bacterium]
MQKAVFLSLLLTAAVMAASSAETGPTERLIPAWQHLWDGQTPVDQGQSTGNNNVINCNEPDRTRTDAGGTGTPNEFDDPNWQEPARDWGSDVLVGERVQEISGRISADNDNLSGDIYVCMLHRDAGVYDTAHMWRSTDGGVNWASYPHVIGGTTQGNIVDAQILCGHGPGDTTWLYFVEATDSVGLRIRRSTPDGATFHWTTIDTNNSIVRVAMDRNIENPEHLFVVWTEADGDIRAMSSTNAGATWGNANYVTSNRRGGSFAAGGAGYGYITYMDDTDSSYYRVGRFTNNLVSPAWSFKTLDSAADQRFREVAVAADRTSPGTSQVAITLVTYRYTGNNNIGPRYAYTTDGGVSWAASFWPVTAQTRSTWLARFPRIRRSYDDELFRAIVSMPETTTSWDTIVYAFTRASDPTSWASRGEYNDHRNTGEVSHDIGSSSLTLGGFIAYRQYASGKVWFDGYDFAGVSAGSTPLQPDRMTAVFGGGVNLSLSARSRVHAAVYDQGGRLVRRLFNGTMEPGRHRLAPGTANGVCFLRLTVNGQTETTKLVQLQ